MNADGVVDAVTADGSGTAGVDGVDAGAPYDEWMRVVMQGAGDFGHREHVHLTWLAVRAVGRTTAVRLVSDGIRRAARYAGAPQKYHATMSRAWVELIARHMHAADSSSDTFDEFAARHPDLLDKRLLTRFYTSAALASRAAREGWVPPDRAPFPTP